MGLDTYFYKLKPKAGTNINSVDDLRHDRLEQASAKFKRGIKKHLEEFENSVLNGDKVLRTAAIVAIANYVKKMNGGYDFYAAPYLKDDITDNKVRELVEHNTKYYYPPEAVYFRKANFVYRFFQPYLEDESCVVTRDMVEELLSRCERVIEVAKEDGALNAKGKIPNKYFYRKDFYNLSEEDREAEIKRVNKAYAKFPKGWIGVAADLLPTQDGFFFGSTEYGVGYLQNIISCKKQFTKLLKGWKDDEVVYCHMSW